MSRYWPVAKRLTFTSAFGEKGFPSVDWGNRSYAAVEGLIASIVDVFNPEHAVANFAALFQVILIDLALAGDNAVAVGLAAAALPAVQQRRAIFWGIVIALVLRIVFATVTQQLLAIDWLLLAGGLLLYWVAWRMWDDLRKHRPIQVGDPVAGEHAAEALVSGGKAPKTFLSALLTIIVADVSMSLDNVLAVAGAAHGHDPIILIFGLGLSVVLMGVAATFIARLLNKHRWIAYVGLAIILFVALHMMYDGAVQVIDCNPTWFGATDVGPHCPSATPPPGATPH